MADTVCVGDFEYKKKDLIGHGAFAVVFKGRKREVNRLFLPLLFFVKYIYRVFKIQVV